MARKIPDGYICAHANQARITTFPLDNPEDSLYSPDVISFARKIKLFSGEDKDFSFSDVYDPVDFDSAHACEKRVWYFFQSVLGEEWGAEYIDYVEGDDLKHRMPLYVKAPSKLSLTDMMERMRNHFEGTKYDMTGTKFSDVGASFAYSPYRW